MVDSHREHPGESSTGNMADITMRNEEETENELLGDTLSTPTARYETVSIPTRDWNVTKDQNERILLELAAIKKKNSTKYKRKSDTDKTATAQKANCSASRKTQIRA